MQNPNSAPLTAVLGLILMLFTGCNEMQPKSGTSVPPKDAIALFDGTDFSQWMTENGGSVPWEIAAGVIEVVPGTGDIMTKQKFQDFKLHIEFNVPQTIQKGKKRERGKSGVYLQRRYEIQVMDSHNQEQGIHDCGSIYGVKAPDKNVCREPGKWQSYDIIFHNARFEGERPDLRKVKNARISVWQNGILTHNDVEVPHKTGSGQPEGPEPAPILLQGRDAGYTLRVRFRNIWVVPL